MPGILATDGNVVAYPFARPLLVDPPSLGPLNKVLIYTRVPVGRLTITAVSDGQTHVTTRGSTDSVTQTFPGYIDVDHAGCWRVEVSDNSQTDVFFLRFELS